MDVISGIDIGGTSTKIGIITKSGEILDRTYIGLKDYNDDLNIFIDTVAHKVKKMCLKHKAILKAVGIGVPNGNQRTGTIEFAPNLPWKEKHPLAQLVLEKLKVPVSLTNDANAAAIGEMKFGNAKNFKDFIMITLGTGVGSGVVVNGNLVIGHDGFAGELGHIIIEPEGRLCNCGRHGCIEEYVSKRGIIQTAVQLLKEGKLQSKFYNFLESEINPKILAEAANAGDELAIEVYRKTGTWLGFQMSNAVAFTSPEAIVFFGGIAQAGDVLMNPLKESLEANLLKIYKNKVQVLLSALPENDAAILGSGALVENYLI